MLFRDLTFTVRSLWRQPGYAATAIITLAVGVGATAAIFSTVNAAVLRPLPYPGAEDLYAGKPLIHACERARERATHLRSVERRRCYGGQARTARPP